MMETIYFCFKNPFFPFCLYEILFHTQTLPNSPDVTVVLFYQIVLDSNKNVLTLVSTSPTL